MTIRLKPELEKFVQAQVESGQYKSAEDAVNAAVAKAQIEQDLSDQDLSVEDIAAIEEGLAQIERGEVIPWEQVRVELEKKIRSK